MDTFVKMFNVNLSQFHTGCVTFDFVVAAIRSCVEMERVVHPEAKQATVHGWKGDWFAAWLIGL